MKTVSLLFVDIFRKRGLQEYNRRICGALETEFSNDKFFAISLYDLKKQNVEKKWRNIKMVFCGRKNLKFLQKISFVFKMIVLILTKNPKFLICAHVDLLPVALFFKKTYGLKYAVLTHALEHCWYLKQGTKYEGLKNAEIIITVSGYSKMKLVTNGVSEGKIKVLNNTVDTSSFCPKPADQRLIDQLGLANKQVLLTVSRLSSQERYKGHDIMLEVLKELGKEYVWLVAGEGDDLPRLREKAENLGANQKVKFLGKIEDEKLIDYYNLCNAFVMPSKGEGFGIVFLEALACGKPVIGGNRDGSTEPLMDGRLGFLVDPDSVEEIKEAINSACTSKEKRTDPDYLVKEVEKNFGIKIFNKRAKELFSEKFR